MAKVSASFLSYSLKVYPIHSLSNIDDDAIATNTCDKEAVKYLFWSAAQVGIAVKGVADATCTANNPICGAILRLHQIFARIKAYAAYNGSICYPGPDFAAFNSIIVIVLALLNNSTLKLCVAFDNSDATVKPQLHMFGLRLSGMSLLQIWVHSIGLFVLVDLNKIWLQKAIGDAPGATINRVLRPSGFECHKIKVGGLCNVRNYGGDGVMTE
eukprot:jgi/Psemu1/7226/gm1.7226_g